MMCLATLDLFFLFSGVKVIWSYQSLYRPYNFNSNLSKTLKVITVLVIFLPKTKGSWPVVDQLPLVLSRFQTGEVVFITLINKSSPNTGH